MFTLPKDLAYTILSYFNLTNLQQLIAKDNLAINYDQLYRFILTNYGLSPIEIERDYVDPVKQKQLTTDESFVKVITYLGQLGYDQQLYVEESILLLLAIKNKNVKLIDYYSQRVDRDQLNNMVLIEAINTGDMAIVNKVKYLLLGTKVNYTNASMIEAWIKNFNINDFTLLNANYVNDSLRFRSTIEIDINQTVSFSITYSYISLPTDIAELNIFALYNVEPGLLRLITVDGVNQLAGINRLVTIGIIDNNDLITSDLIDRIDPMRLLILQLPASVEREYYLLQLDVLQGNDIDFESDIIDDHILNLLFSVLHPQVLLVLNHGNIELDTIEVKNSDVIYSPANFLSLVAQLGYDIRNISELDFELKSLWQSIWLAGVQWLAVVDQPLPVGPLEWMRTVNAAKNFRDPNHQIPIITVEMYKHLLLSPLTKNNKNRYVFVPLNLQQKSLFAKLYK